MARGKKVILEPENIEEVNVEEIKPVVKSKYYPKCELSNYELTTALREIGVDHSYAHRAEIFKANGYENYLGLGSQNKIMLDLLKDGLLLKA